MDTCMFWGTARAVVFSYTEEGSGPSQGRVACTASGCACCRASTTTCESRRWPRLHALTVPVFSLDSTLCDSLTSTLLHLFHRDPSDPPTHRPPRYPLARSAEHRTYYLWKSDTLGWPHLMAPCASEGASTIVTRSVCPPSILHRRRRLFQRQLISAAALTPYLLNFFGQSAAASVPKIFLALPSPNSGPTTMGLQASPASFLAAADVNKDPSVLPGVELELAMYDHQCNPGLGIKGLVEVMQNTNMRPLVGIVDGGCSAVSKSVADIARWYSLVSVSGIAAAPILSDKVQRQHVYITV